MAKTEKSTAFDQILGNVNLEEKNNEIITPDKSKNETNEQAEILRKEKEIAANQHEVSENQKQNKETIEIDLKHNEDKSEEIEDEIIRKSASSRKTFYIEEDIYEMLRFIKYKTKIPESEYVNNALLKMIKKEYGKEWIKLIK